MVEVRNCPRCQTDVSADAPEGLCPACLLQQAIEGPHDEQDGAAGGRSPAQRFVPPTPAELARHFPQLEIIELLGQGGMGAVYKARQTKLDRLVAIKILPPAVARDTTFAERFLREARTLARLSHPHIVTVHDFGDVDGLYYFTMEYVDGHNLRDLMQAGPLPAAEARAIALPICEALHYAHDEGLVHRDIKPENILLDRKGRVKIADFGLARLVGLTPNYLTLTGTHEVMGTLLYMAPEQMKQAHSVDHRADLYSLGVILYEMVTGELPLGRFAPPSRKAPVDERFDQVVLRALAREPAERYQDAAALKQDVEAALSGRDGLASPRLSAHGKPIWPTVRFELHLDGISTPPRGLIHRDDDALILEFDGADKRLWKKFKAFFCDPEVPQEVRIPLHEIASLSYGWGWGKPPRSLVLRVAHLRTLARVPGSDRGHIKFYIPREDRAAARRLVESLSPNRMDGGVPGPHPRMARNEVAAPATGLLVAGVLTLLFAFLPWPVLNPHGELSNLGAGWMALFIGAALTLSLVAGVLIAGARAMRRLRGYPLAATAAIVAMIPWSPAWLISFPFGLWTCIVLGRPEVTEVFLGDAQPAPGELPSGQQPRPHMADRLLSLCRSVGRCFLPTTMGPLRPTSNTGEGSSSTSA